MDTLQPVPPPATHRMELELVGLCGAVIGVLLVALFLTWLYRGDRPRDD